MENTYDIYVSRIHAIIQKSEIGDFHFVNKCRQWDGVVLFTEGKGIYIDRNRDRGTFSKGTVLPLRKGDRYEVHSIGSCSYITSRYDIQTTDGSPLPRLPFKIVDDDKLVREIIELYETWQKHSWDSIISCRIALLGIYHEMYRHTAGIKEDEDNIISKAKHYIHENYGENYSFEYLCRSLPLSPSYLRTKFKKCTGMTVSQYRNHLRITNAKEMIESGHFTMKEITNKLGYCDANHFSKAFKAHTGFSPKAYMKKAQKRLTVL